MLGAACRWGSGLRPHDEEAAALPQASEVAVVHCHHRPAQGVRLPRTNTRVFQVQFFYIKLFFCIAAGFFSLCIPAQLYFLN